MAKKKNNQCHNKVDLKTEEAQISNKTSLKLENAISKVGNNQKWARHSILRLLKAMYDNLGRC